MALLRHGLAAVLSVGLATAGVVTLPSPAAAAPAPIVGNCFSYPATTLGKASSGAPAIGCESPHTAETYRVGPLPDDFGLPSEASPPALLSAGRACTVQAMNTYLGIPDRVLPSRFLTVVLFPTDAQWNAGERWVRCDVVLQGGRELVTTTGTAAALVAANPVTRFDFCTPGEPNAVNTKAYPCTKPKKNWIKVLDYELGGPGSKFPGNADVERRTRNLCEKQGKKYDGKVEFPGWWAIWPTDVGWKEGRRSAQCFVPYAQYLAEIKPKKPRPTPAPTPAPAPAPAPTATPEPAPAPAPAP